MLKKSFENEALCISPYIWQERHKQLSYLGLSCSFIDADYHYRTVDLCCRSYYEVDHSADNILAVRRWNINIILIGNLYMFMIKE